MTMSDRIAIMNHGRIEQVGHPARDLRAAGHAVRRALPRRGEPDRRHGRAESRRRMALPCTRMASHSPGAAVRRQRALAGAASFIRPEKLTHRGTTRRGASPAPTRQRRGPQRPFLGNITALRGRGSGADDASTVDRAEPRSGAPLRVGAPVVLPGRRRQPDPAGAESAAANMPSPPTRRAASALRAADAAARRHAALDAARLRCWRWSFLGPLPRLRHPDVFQAGTR